MRSKYSNKKGANGPKWEWGVVHDSMIEGKKHDKRKGNGFPGLRADIHHRTSPRIIKCLEPVMEIVDPKTDLTKVRHDERSAAEYLTEKIHYLTSPFRLQLTDVQSLYGLLAPYKGDDGVLWLDSQRLPHVKPNTPARARHRFFFTFYFHTFTSPFFKCRMIFGGTLASGREGKCRPAMRR